MLKKEIDLLVDFLKEFFGNELLRVVVYGSVLRWSFRSDSDIDIAVILLDSPKWRWSVSISHWFAWSVALTPARLEFYARFEQLAQQEVFSHEYDVKLLTPTDLDLLDKFHKEAGLRRGDLALNIRRGKVLFDNLGGKR